MSKKLPLDKINGTKNALFFLSQVPTKNGFTFNLRFLYELKHKICLFEFMCGISHFRFRFVFIEVYIFVGSLTLKRHNSFQNEINRKVTHSFAPRPLIFKLQQEVLKFRDKFFKLGKLKI